MVRALATGVVRPNCIALWTLLASVALAACPLATAAEPERPDFRRVAEAVVGYFRTVPNFQAGDPMCQGQLAAALDAVAAVGWNVPQREALIARALPDNSFLLKEMATPAGRDFMRHVAKQPGGYARPDRPSPTSRGKKLIPDLINAKAGDLMTEDLAPTSGGFEMGKMMADTPGGVDLNKPTGRIYAIEDLLQALAEVYAAHAK